MVQNSAWKAPTFPKLRKDLQVKRPPKDGSIFKVKIPESESICLLYDVEVTIARLMNGNRDLDAIVSAGQAAGVPVTRELLESFIRELAAYQFIENADPLPSWTQRKKEGIIENLEPLAESAPESKEAKMFSSIGDRGSGDADRGGGQQWVEGLLETGKNLTLGAFGKFQTFLSNKRRSPALWIACAVALGIVALIVTRPFGHRKRQTFACQLVPEEALDVRASVTALLVEVSVAEGQRVHKGDLLARQEDVVLRNELRKLQAEVQKLEAEVNTMRLAQDSGRRLEAEHRVAALKEQLTTNKRAIARLPRSSKAKRARLSALLANQKQLQKQYDESRRQLALFKAAMAPGALEGKVQALSSAQERQRTIEKRLSTLEVRAPKDGLVVYATSEAKGKFLKEDDVIVQLANADRFRANLWVPEAEQRKISVGSRIKFTPADQVEPALGTVTSISLPIVRPEGNAVRVETEFTNDRGNLRPGLQGTVAFD